MSEPREAHEFTTAEAAVKFAKLFKGRYMVHVKASLPTKDGYAFPGSTCLIVTKKQFVEIVRDVASRAFLDRGARVRFEVLPGSFGGQPYLVLC